MKTVKSAVILAAGFGTRLRPLTDNIAKPVLPFFNRSVISHIIQQLEGAGVNDIYVNLHYQGWSIRRIIRLEKSAANPIVFSYEPKILGTAGALEPLKPYLKDKTFFLVNGDVLTDLDYKMMARQHFQNKIPSATLALHPPSTNLGFPAIGSTDSNLLSRFPYGRHKTGSADWEGTFMGVHIVSPEILKYIQGRRFQCINSGIYSQAINDDCIIATYRHDGYWNDIGTPQRYFDAHSDFLTGRFNLPHIIKPTLNHWISPSAQLASGTEIRNTVVIGSDAVIEKNCRLDNVVIWPGSKLKKSSSLKNGILMNNGRFLSLYERGPNNA